MSTMAQRFWMDQIDILLVRTFRLSVARGFLEDLSSEYRDLI